MNKNYIKPSVKVIEIAASEILAGSETMGYDSTSVDAGSARSKRNTIVWDDEEE